MLCDFVVDKDEDQNPLPLGASSGVSGRSTTCQSPCPILPSYSGLDDLSHQLHSRQSSFLSPVHLTLLGLLYKPPCWSCRRWASGLCHLEQKGRHWDLDFLRLQGDALLHFPHFRGVREARYLLPRPLLRALAGRAPARACCPSPSSNLPGL